MTPKSTRKERTTKWRGKIWRTISAINENVRVRVREWIRNRTAAKKAENHRKDLDSIEEPFDPTKDQPNPKWWEKSTGMDFILGLPLQSLRAPNKEA